MTGLDAAFFANRAQLARTAAWAAFVIGVGLFLYTVVSRAGSRGLWADEYWTLFLADPATPLTAFIYDVHPPLHAGLVRLAVALGLGGGAALVAVNLVTIAIAAAGGFWIIARSKGVPFALALFGIVFASTPVLTFALEGRDYVMAQFACVTLTMAAMTRAAKDSCLEPYVFALLAAACAAIHLFAAIYAGSLGVALIVLGMVYKRRADIVAGLAVGLGTTVTTLIWIIIAREAMFDDGMNWLKSGIPYMLEQFWFARTMLGSAGPNSLLFAIAVGICLFIAPARPYAILLVTASAVFFILPSVVSLFKPMLQGRYLSIAIPGILAMGAAAVIEAARTIGTQRLSLAAGLIGALFFAISLGLAPSVAWRLDGLRPVYAAADVRAALKGCSNPRVRVFQSEPDAPNRPYLNGADVHLASYRHALAQSEVKLDPSRGPMADVADYPCAVVAWGEHITKFVVGTATIDEILGVLNLTNRNNIPLQVERRVNGLLLLRQ